MLSALAATLSLMFVGLEIRQNTGAMRGATTQAIPGLEDAVGCDAT